MARWAWWAIRIMSSRACQPVSRRISTCIYVALWAGYFAWRAISARMANAKLMKSVAGEDTPAAPAPAGSRESAADLAAISQRMQEAVAILKKMRPCSTAAGASVAGNRARGLALA